jgi:hypothetical protein
VKVNSESRLRVGLEEERIGTRSFVKESRTTVPMTRDVRPELDSLLSPKRNALDESARASWYPFYAGFSPSFVRSALSLAGLATDGTVLDPWNGSGTTTRVAWEKGLRSIGCEINPALLIVACAKTIEGPGLNGVNVILKRIKSARFGRLRAGSPDALDPWLTPESVAHVRALDTTIRNGLRFGEVSGSPELSLVYLAFFRVLRRLLAGYLSNPTWVRIPRKSEPRQEIGSQHLRSLLASELEALCRSIEPAAPAQIDRTCRLLLGDSRDLPLETASIDAVVGSPPYCTRLDYVASTRIELALLGLMPNGMQEELRKRTIGSPLTGTYQLERNDDWGPTCSRLLSRVLAHKSKASSTYYARFMGSYFCGLFGSLREIGRVLKPGATATIVVQSSLYKELLVDLPGIVCEMAENVGLEEVGRHEYSATWVRSTQNPRARRYTSSRKVSEFALRLRRDTAGGGRT